jgi:isopentenyldiphosphate isomerase
MPDEWFPLVTPTGQVIGRVLRSEAHGNPDLLHPVVHCLILDGRGRLLLQLRSRNKDVQPGRWDTSVGGHMAEGETPLQAVRRETAEELGIELPEQGPQELYRYLLRSPIESELVTTFLWHCEGPFHAQPEEIDELRFWSVEEIRSELGKGVFTPNFEDEFARLQSLELSPD